MPIIECHTCGNTVEWQWEEAFDKFGFNDGDGLVRTSSVQESLENHSYKVKAEQWGLHNEIIVSIIDPQGKELLADDSVRYGYDCPRTYLPTEVIELLDEALPDDAVED